MSENSSGGFNIGDFAGLSEPLKKLIEVVSSGTGRLFQASFTRKDADAKAYEIRTLAAAKADAFLMLSESVRDASPGTGGITITEDGATISSLPAHEDARLPNLPMLSLEQRTESRTSYQDAIRQQNIESVTAIAAEQLKDEPDVSTDPVDPDWILRFFRYTEDISDEKMQFIWGRILAGEVKKPNSYSLRTLQTIRNLAPNEAALFSKYSERVILDFTGPPILLSVDFYEKININEINILEEAGLISPTELTKVLPKIRQTDARVMFEADGIVMAIVIPIESTVSINSLITYYQLTIAGAEIYRLSGAKPNMDGFFSIGKKAKGLGLDVSAGPVFSRTSDGGVNQWSPTINIDDV